jgi:GT2 family glycosyltransferase/glycosyltransferase involved in cell wall biosynthesis/SAM-dependent methyltransferase
MISNQRENFNTLYHNLRGEEHDQSDQNLIGLFESLADRIIMDIRPASVLDAGCGRGYLLIALRRCGVEAWGIDNSEASIQNALPESQPYCQIGSIVETFPHSHYDLIVCIDVIEHLSPKEAERAVENLCSYSDDILLSCTPVDFFDSAHLNVQPPDYWVGLFSRFGFIHEIDFDASFIAPWAMRFRKIQLSTSDMLSNYEQKLWLLSQENDLRRSQGIEQLLELSRNEYQFQHQIQYWKSVNGQTQAKLDAILNSTSWRFMTRVHYYRERFIPIGSRREKAMRIIFRILGIFRREGLIGFFVLAFQKLIGDIESRFTKLQRKLKLRASSSPNIGQVCELDSLTSRLKVGPHATSVDIIICVHNALEDVRRCLVSLLEYTTQTYRLILVDDGSNELTEKYLLEFADSHHALLLRSEKATGYTYAANRGMRSSSAEFLVLLNSDTILTPEWLDRFVSCIQSDPKVGIVGPLSNTASWQSVPKIEETGDWASNPLPEGLSPARMAQLIASNSARLYMEMPLLNGFCLMIRRKLLDEVGLFDEDSFGQGYGEEDDLVLRARNLGWKMALADDVYIYHAQSKSYSSDQRHVLSERAGKILRNKHGERIISQGVRFCQQDPVLEGIRARSQVSYDRDQNLWRGKVYSGRRLLFILPINSPGGGANVIRSESLAMQQMGVKVVFFNLETHREGFVKSYPDLSQSTIFGKPEDLELAAQNYDAVIATYNPTVGWLQQLQSKQTHPVLGYYIQGFEPWMYAQSSLGYKIALDSYTLIDDMTLFCKTEWTRQQVKEATGRESEVIGASVDIDLYRPRPRNTPLWPNGPLRIAAMIRPESPYREPLKTMELLHKTFQKYKGEVEILLFGTPYENPAFQVLPHDFPWKIYGVLSPEQVANLLSQVDIFVDYSSHQAMGLTAMEAMACGCAAIVPKFGGASSYALHERNSLIADTSTFENVWLALQRLVEDEKLRNHLQRNAIQDICAYFPEHSALNILSTLFQR